MDWIYLELWKFLFFLNLKASFHQFAEGKGINIFLIESQKNEEILYRFLDLSFILEFSSKKT